MDDQFQPFGFFQWFSRAGQHLLSLYGWPMLVLAVAGLSVLVSHRNDLKHPSAAMPLLTVFAGLHIVIGRQGVYVHDWWWWPIAPALAIAAGVGLSRLLQVIDRHSRRVAGLAGVLVLVIFAGWTTWITAAPMLRPPTGILNDSASHTLSEIGLAVRGSVPRDECAIIVENDRSAALWYYLDRPVIHDVWDVQALRRRMESPTAGDLPFGFTEPLVKPPRVLVLPRCYEPFAEDLLQYLEANYVQIDPVPALSGKFRWYDLSGRK